MSKKFLRILLPLLLAALLAVTAAGCGSSGGSSGGGSGASLDGTYTGEADMTASMSESSGLEIQTKLAMHFILTLSSGKDYTIELDAEQFVADTKNYYETEMPSLMKQGLINEGYTEEQIDELVKQQGFASFEEFVNSYLQETLASVEEEFANKDSVISKGTYKTDGATISLEDAESGKSAATNGKIGNDGSLTFDLTLNGSQHEVVFRK